MEKIFEKIPNAQDVKGGVNENVNNTIQNFVLKVSRVLEQINKDSINIKASREDGELINGIHGEKIKEAFRQKGWNIEYILDSGSSNYYTDSQEELSYIRVSMNA